MLHHVSLAVRDLAVAGAFYDAAMGALGYRRVFQDQTAIGYGIEDGKDKFCLKLRSNPVAPGPGFHLAFDAPSRESIHTFHAKALAAGGTDNGAPGPRPNYGQHYYAAFVIDPDGHHVEAVANGPVGLVGHATNASPGNRQVIVALDFESAAQAFRLVEQLGAAAYSYKVGLQLLTAQGPSVVRQLVTAGKQVFLDLKLFEIPNSVAGAVAAAGQLGVGMVTVHASGGTAVLRAAVDAARPFPQLKVLALTVITSMREQELREVGVSSSVREQVLRLAKLAVAAGCHGVVASPQEAGLLRAALPGDALIVTPGTQLPGEAPTDQARTATPAEAIRAGSTHLVIGRSISRSPDPVQSFLAICDQIGQAVAQRAHDPAALS